MPTPGKTIPRSAKPVPKICTPCIMIYAVFLFSRLFRDLHNKSMVSKAFCGNSHNFSLMSRTIFRTEKPLDSQKRLICSSFASLLSGSIYQTKLDLGLRRDIATFGQFWAVGFLFCFGFFFWGIFLIFLCAFCAFYPCYILRGSKYNDVNLLYKFVVFRKYLLFYSLLSAFLS